MIRQTVLYGGQEISVGRPAAPQHGAQWQIALVLHPGDIDQNADRRSAAKASSVTLSADVDSWTQTCCN